MKTIIIGGVAGGATAAARLRRLDEKAEIIILERGEYVSFANCGLPYYIGGVITDREDELYAIILDDLRRVTHFARKKERQFAEYINRKNTTQLRQDITALQMEIETLRKCRNELTSLFKRL